MPLTAFDLTTIKASVNGAIDVAFQKVLARDEEAVRPPALAFKTQLCAFGCATRSFPRAGDGERTAQVFKSGFSVLEAIVVLAITAMALTLIFSVGSKAADQGFTLGRRAISSGDRSIGIDSYRLAVSGIVLPVPVQPGLDPDPPFEGSSTELAFLSSLQRPIVCSPAGRTLISLTLKKEGGQTAVFCRAGGAPSIPIFQMKGDAAFSYSLDGQTWSDTFTVSPGMIGGKDTQSSTLETSANIAIPPVYVRLATRDGAEQILAVSIPQRPTTRPNQQGPSPI